MIQVNNSDSRYKIPDDLRKRLDTFKKQPFTTEPEKELTSN